MKAIASASRSAPCTRTSSPAGVWTVLVPSAWMSLTRAIVTGCLGSRRSNCFQTLAIVALDLDSLPHGGGVLAGGADAHTSNQAAPGFGALHFQQLAGQQQAGLPGVGQQRGLQGDQFFV